MRVIAFVFTGGTISMKVDPVHGGAVPALSAAEMLSAARGIEDVCRPVAEEWGRFPGPHMSLERQWSLRTHLLELSESGSVDGIVVAHGTDTLEETAYMVARSVPARVPIVFTGAMRNASDLDSDGPTNLLDAARVASSDALRGGGVLVVMGGDIFSAQDITKRHTHARDAFASPVLGTLGVVDDGAVRFMSRAVSLPEVVRCDMPASPVDIVTSHAGADSRALISLLPESRGVVIAALGRGNVPPEMLPGVCAWLDAGKPVVVSSRTGNGRTGATYAYDGGARKLLDMGVVLAGARRPQQARIDLMLALGAGLDRTALAAMLDA
ncbi:MAG TPA: asparaginase [Gemmatimonadales bacterium]|nr:asparaginase [Gemmatimonadales bacterium]